MRPGIFSMHDFHVFRLFEYDKCVSDLQLPCRWAPDGAFEYGQPLFNFYTQTPYIFGEFFRLIGFSVLDSTKIVFAMSLIISALFMFVLSKQLWKNNLAAIASALVYTYAPYRAVDVWVRGALPEALAFVFFPLIIYFFNDFVLRKSTKSLILFSVSFAGLILTHNLSALMFAPFLAVWGGYFLTKEKAWRLISKFALAGILIFGLTAFYILPVIFESQFITLGKTAGGYYDFHNHFVSLKQLLISRYWGYGASVWGDDDRMSLAIGLVQWILPTLILIYLILKRILTKNLSFLILFLLGWLMLFLAHQKSVFLWEIIPGFKFIQFPWRFLSPAVFIFSLSLGAIFISINKRIQLILVSVVISLAILLNTNYFKEDIWQDFNDQSFFSGNNYQIQISSALSDFWPIYGNSVPSSKAFQNPVIIQGSGSAKLVEKKSNNVSYYMDIKSAKAEIQMPIVYFPGWEARSLKGSVKIYPSGDLGLITANVSPMDQELKLVFKDTNIRMIGNIISLLGIVVILGWLFKILKKK